MQQEETEGWVVPVHQSLLTPVMVAGVPRPVAVILVAFTMIVSGPLGMWFLGIPLGIFFYVVARALSQWEELWFEIGRLHLLLPSIFEVD